MLVFQCNLFQTSNISILCCYAGVLILVKDQSFMISEFWHFVVTAINDLLEVSKNLIFSNTGGLIS